MCRVLSFLGSPILLADLLINSSCSLIKQTHNAHYLHNMLNLGGFGLCAWSEDFESQHGRLLYKTIELPFYDKNLESLSNNLKSHCFLAHIRGVVLSTEGTITNENVHPFLYRDYQLAFAHNGTLTGLNKMKASLYPYIRPEVYLRMSGTTDSEWLYAIMMSQFDDPTKPISLEMATHAITDTLGIIMKVRKECRVDTAAPLNLFMTNGDYIVAVRYVANYGNFPSDMELAHMTYHSMWYTYGDQYRQHEGVYKMVGTEKRSNLILASEPLSDDVSNWLEVPEYSITTAWRDGSEVRFMTNGI